MNLNTTFLNQQIELFDCVFDEAMATELRSLSALYGAALGPITALNLVRPEAQDFSMFSAYSHHLPLQRVISDLTVKASPYADIVPGGGKGASLLRPILGALGEMTERFLAMMHFTALADRVIYGTFDDLQRRGLNSLLPAGVPLFADEQYAGRDFEYQPFTNDALVGWIEGYDLVSAESVWVPAQLVLMYYKPHPQETPIGYATTAGLAFHPFRQAAVLHGLYEVIERDALNIRWYSNLAPTRIDLDLNDEFRHLSRFQPRLGRGDMEIVTLELTLDSPIPVLATIAYDHSRRERCFLGGTGANSRRRQALAQALFELGQCQTAFRFEDPFGRLPITAETTQAELRDFFDAPLFYGHARNVALTYWFSSPLGTKAWQEVVDFDFASLDDEYTWAIDWLRGSELHPVVFDFDAACRDVGSLTKVFVPQLTHACPPLNPMLGHPRFREVPRRLGLQSPSFADLNPHPIPFA